MIKRGNKAQGLSLTTIIIAILVIIVLVVVVLIFTGRMHIFGKSLDLCDPEDCVNVARDCDKETTIAVPMDCDKDHVGMEYCCKTIS